MLGALARVESMLAADAPFGDVEDFIEESGLGGEAQSALWLLAWVESDREQCRDVVRELLAGLSVE